MASKRRLNRVRKQSACTGKRYYETTEEALLAVKQTRKVYARSESLHTLAGQSLVPYKCTFCGKYHIGHYRI